ncbi:MAG: EAL domain-containing protein [Selenomonas sp.]|nr:EAL domain-containing protein [Selenomonas sp.]
MRRLLRTLAGLFFLALFLPAVAALSAPSVQAEMKPVPVLRVGYMPLPGVFFKDEHELYKGTAFEYLSTVSSYMGNALDFSAGTEKDNLEKLQAGELDLVSTTMAHDEEGLSSLSLGPSLGFVTFRAADEILGARLQKAIQEVDAISPFYRVHLLEAYRPQNAPFELTEEEKAYLKGKKVLHCLTSEGQPPYTYFKDGEHLGIIADIMELISTDLGLPITAAPLQGAEARRQAMASGEIDFLANIYDDYNWAAENEVWLTKPYLQIDYVAVMNRDRPLPEAPVIACTRGHFYNRAYTEYQYPSSQVHYYPTLQDCLEAVNDGKADIVFTKAFTVQNDIYAGGYLNLYTTGNVVFSHKVSIGVSRHADPRLLSILNKEISHLKSQQIASIITRHAHSMSESGTLFALIYFHPMRTIGLVALISLGLLLSAGLFLWQKRRHHEEIYRMAYTDPLTGLHNMAWLTREMPLLIKQHSQLRREGKLFVMSATIDRLAFMKETYDLKLLMRSMLGSLHDSLEKNPWLLAYAINSEGTCLYFLCCEPEGMTMQQAAEKFILDGAVIKIGKVPTTFTHRVGLMPVPPKHEVSTDWLLDCAYSAKMEAIATDQNLCVYDENIAVRFHQRQEIEALMHKALAAQEFQVWLQPKYDLLTRNTLGAEALVRWNSPELGFLPPGAFMDIFERNGFAVELDYYVLERVCEIQSARLKKNLPTLPISVNQSGLHLTEQGYLGRMRSLMDRWQLIPGLIELEITETAFIDFTTRDQREDAAQIIDDLQEIGFSLSMDDFCTGYSSLSMLQNLPMNVMKIDRSILWEAEKSPRSMNILHHVIALGKALSMNVLVEGIESEEQEKHLLKLGCDSGQGYFYARPMPVKEFYEEFLPKHS